MDEWALKRHLEENVLQVCCLSLNFLEAEQRLQKVCRPPLPSLAAASSQGFALCLSFSGNVIVRKTKEEFQTRKVQRIAFLAEMGSS